MDAQSGTGLLSDSDACYRVLAQTPTSLLRSRARSWPGRGPFTLLERRRLGVTLGATLAALLELVCGCRSNTDRSVPVFGPDRRYGSSNSDSQDSPSISIPTLATVDASNPAIHAIATSKSSARWNRCRFRSSQTCSLNKASRTPCEWIARQPLRPSPGSLPDLLLDLCAAHQPARWRGRPVQA